MASAAAATATTTTSVFNGGLLPLRHRCRAAILLLLISVVTSSSSPWKPTPPTGKDPLVVPCKDLRGSLTVFESTGLDDFSQMLIDAERSQLIVGARDHLLRLDLVNLTLLERVSHAPDNITVSVCVAKGQPKDDCQNFIRVLLLHKDEVFVCGTNAFSPQCSWRQPDKLSAVSSWVAGVAKCPYNPQHNATFIMTSDDNFYSATVTDFTARDSAIYRMMGPAKYLRTVQYNSRWLNEPDFVSVYEIGDFVYFFFRETAIEFINCGKRVFSRVARICKNDPGGKFLLEDNWTTFLKARLNCSLPGAYPFYFNELQSTHYVPEKGLIYAVFTTPSTSIYGSAVCAYNLSALDQAFSSPFKYQVDASAAWTRVPNNSPSANCGASNPDSKAADISAAHQRQLVDAQKYQMMDNAVQPTQLEPLIVAENERFSHVIVDQVAIARHAPSHTVVSVVFLTTLEGAVKKYVLTHGDNDSIVACLLEVLDLPCTDGKQSRIRSLQLSTKQNALYIGTTHRVYRLATHRCGRFSSKLQCLGAQDPYCGWSDAESRCSPVGHPHLSSCPIVTFPVDGGFCAWSPWQPCYQSGVGYESSSHCMCRMRSCDCPTPQHGGRSCTGRTIEVSNCTVHGGWTEWSAWSGCSATCGQAFRTRHRSCSNPKPQSGGRVCVGEDVVMEDCTLSKCRNDNLFQSLAESSWSAWSQWSLCSERCGGGFQTRTRSCQSSLGTHFVGRSNGCVGNDHEWTACNSAPCDEVRKLSDWSPWLRVNTSRDGSYVAERFRCVCKASVADMSHVRAPQIRTAMRYCTAAGQDCETGYHLNIPDVDGSWSAWSQWSECTSLCGGGTRQRERLCNSPPPSGTGRECSGHSREQSDCNTHSCQGQWTCWSDYGQCSVSCGGVGRRWRKRQCEPQPPGEYYTLPCRGGDLQEMSCTAPPCEGFIGWTDWSAWVPCTPAGVQLRYRNCSAIADDTRYCQGPDVETRPCVFDVDNDYSDAVLSTTVHDVSNPIRYYHMIVVGILCFLLGAIMSFIITMHCHRVAFGNKDSSSSSGVSVVTAEKCDVVPSSAAAVDFSFFPTARPLVRTSGDSVQLDDGVRTATNSSQTALMDLRQYYYRTDLFARDVHYSSDGSPHNVPDSDVSGHYKAYHLVVVGLVGFVIGALSLFALVVVCWRRLSSRFAGGEPAELRHCEVKQNNYISPFLFAVKQDYYNASSTPRTDSTLPPRYSRTPDCVTRSPFGNDVISYPAGHHSRADNSVDGYRTLPCRRPHTRLGASGIRSDRLATIQRPPPPSDGRMTLPRERSHNHAARSPQASNMHDPSTMNSYSTLPVDRSSKRKAERNGRANALSFPAWDPVSPNGRMSYKRPHSNGRGPLPPIVDHESPLPAIVSAGGSRPLTVREATVRRDAIARTGSLLRTRLDINDGEL